MKELKTTAVTQETHPQYFIKGSALTGFDTSGLIGLKDASDVEFINDYQAAEHQFLRISVNKCTEAY